jgi:hypothetical protein
VFVGVGFRGTLLIEQQLLKAAKVHVGLLLGTASVVQSVGCSLLRS